MAGIGFELNKLFREKGLSGRMRGIGYSFIIIAGPLLLGMSFVFLISNLAILAGMEQDECYLMVIQITYVTIASLFTTGAVTYPLTRYVSDQLYVNHNEKVIPSLFGCLSIIVPPGAVLWGLFVWSSGLSAGLIVTNIALYTEVTSIFIVINYLTAVKNYRGILLSYLLSTGTAVLSAYLFTRFAGPSLIGFMISIALGYGVQLLTGVLLLLDFFPVRLGGYFDFLPWFPRYWQLVVVGLAMDAALFGHLILIWHSDIGLPIQGNYWSASQYDIPALYSYLATLVTTIYFVTSAETKFYPKYNKYYGSLNFGGNVQDVSEARKEMLATLWNDVLHGAVIQFLFTLGMLSVGLILFERLQPGFTMQMKNYYILLSVSYGMYATGNMMTLYSMYFTDYRSVLIDSVIFAAVSTFGTHYLIMITATEFYGAGFMVGCFSYLLVSYIRLRGYTGKLDYEVLGLKPFVARKKKKKKKGEDGTEDEE